MSIASKLGKTSSFFFFSGLVFGKAQLLPIPIVSSILNMLSLLSYLLAYAFWFISSHCYPDQMQIKDEWYGFAPFKEQYLFAATLGIMATILSMAAFYIPILIGPATWLIFASNLMWVFAEYHKFHNPPAYEKNYSHNYQEAYLSHAITLTGMSFVAASSITLVYFIPVLSFPVFIASTILITGLSLLSAKTWLNFTFGGHQPDIQEKHPKQITFMNNQSIPTPACAQEPYHGEDLFKKPANISTQLALVENSFPSQTCSIPIN